MDNTEKLILIDIDSDDEYNNYPIATIIDDNYNNNNDTFQSNSHCKLSKYKEAIIALILISIFILVLYMLYIHNLLKITTHRDSDSFNKNNNFQGVLIP